MTDWVRKKSVELSRNIFEIGRSLKESLSLRHKFERLVAEVKVSLRQKIFIQKFNIYLFVSHFINISE